MSKIAVLTAAVLFAISFLCPLRASELPEIEGAEILMIIAPKNFRDEELFLPMKIFKTQLANVTVASSTLEEVGGMLGKTVKPDIHYEKVNVQDFNAVVFVGGVGARGYFDDDLAHKIARQALEKEKVLAAICLAPGILARAGILNGKKATVWKAEAPSLKKMGVNYTGKRIEIDGDIITADGPKAAGEFAEEIVRAIARNREKHKE